MTPGVPRRCATSTAPVQATVEPNAGERYGRQSLRIARPPHTLHTLLLYYVIVGSGVWPWARILGAYPGLCRLIQPWGVGACWVTVICLCLHREGREATSVSYQMPMPEWWQQHPRMHRHADTDTTLLSPTHALSRCFIVMDTATRHRSKASRRLERKAIRTAVQLRWHRVDRLSRG